MHIRTCFVTFALATVLLFTGTAGATQITGNQWKEFPKEAQDLYVMGVSQGWESLTSIAYSPNVGEPSATDMVHKDLIQCLASKHVTYAQMSAMTREYTESNPSRWHLNMPDLMFLSMLTICPLQYPAAPDDSGKKSVAPKIRSGKNRF